MQKRRVEKMELLCRELLYPLGGGTTPSCHAATLCLTGDGDVRAAWFGGTGESRPDVEIWSAVRHNGVWSAPEMCSVPGDIACWNPVLYAAEGEITLFFKRGAVIPEWKTYVRRLRGDGVWSEEAELVPGDCSGGRGPVKNKPIRLSDGRLLAGASHESHSRRWQAFADISCDGGRHWERTAYVPAAEDVQLIQPTLWESADGVHMLLRSNQGVIYRSDAALPDLRFCPAYPTDLPNNNSGIDLAALPDGTLALCCNPVGSDWGARSPLSLMLSRDNGKSWTKELDLAAGEGEYSYPAVICGADRLHIAFTYRRKSVMYAQVSF